MQKSIEQQSTVFVVDDSPDVREALGDLFRSVGLRCRTFGSIDEFLEAKDPHGPHCLVLDVRLPGLSGLDLQTELPKTGRNIPIVFITGHGDIPMAVKAMKAGAVDFLSKPFREQDLLDAVAEALSRDQAVRISKKEWLNVLARYNSLTEREQTVMSLVCAGLMNKQVAAELDISEITVKVHRHNIMEKMRARSLAELVRMESRLKAFSRNSASNPSETDT